MHSAAHPKHCVERLYLSCAKIEEAFNTSVLDAVEKEVSGLRSYIDKAEKPLV